MATETDAQTARLAERFARAKGRYHSQHAMCDLMDHLGLPCTRPGREALDPLPSPVTPAMLDAAEETYMPFGDMQAALEAAIAEGRAEKDEPNE